MHHLLARQALPLLFLGGFKRSHQQIAWQINDHIQLLPAAQHPVDAPLNILRIARCCLNEKRFVPVFVQAATQRVTAASVIAGDGNPVVPGGGTGQGLAERAAAASDQEGG